MKTITRLLKRLAGAGKKSARGALRLAGQGYSVRGTLTADEVFTAGDVSVELMGNQIVLGIGSEFALVMRPDRDADARHVVRLHCISERRVPQISALPAKAPPLCKFGPGGDYQVGYTPAKGKSETRNPKPEIGAEATA